MYADDIVLLALSVKGLQSLINVCHRFGLDNDKVFNGSKTMFMKIVSSEDLRSNISFPPVFLGEQEITSVNDYMYLGHYVSDNLYDDLDIKIQTRDTYARANMLSRNFNYCSNDVKHVLFTTYMYSIYCCTLLSVCSRSVV